MELYKVTKNTFRYYKQEVLNCRMHGNCYIFNFAVISMHRGESAFMHVLFTCTIYSMVENCGMSSAGWFTSDIPA